MDKVLRTAGQDAVAVWADTRLRDDLLVVADSPALFSDHILRLLESPDTFNGGLLALREEIAVEYAWGRRADQFLAHVPTGQ